MQGPFCGPSQLASWPQAPGPIISHSAGPGDQVSASLHVAEMGCWGLKIISRLLCPVAWFLTQAVWCLLGEGVCVSLGTLYFSFCI